MAKRAGNLFSDEEITKFRTEREQEILEKLPGLRHLEIDGMKYISGLFGRPMIVVNSNPVAVWINFIHHNGAKSNPLQGRNHDLELDPFVESLLAIEHLLTEATIHKQKFNKFDLAKNRFKIALSFAGENRVYVSQVADIIEKTLGEDCIFYDLNYQAHLARPNLDTILQQIYRNADLVVVFLCEKYSEKEWCGLEWRAIREIIKQKQDDKVMFMRFDNVILPGTFSIDGYIDLRKLSPAIAAHHILDRYHQN